MIVISSCFKKQETEYVLSHMGEREFGMIDRVLSGVDAVVGVFETTLNAG